MDQKPANKPDIAFDSPLHQLGIFSDTTQGEFVYCYDDCWYEDVASAIQTGVLGFCSCGRPCDNLEYIRRGLELIDEKSGEEDFHKWFAGHQQRELAHFMCWKSAYFFYYWADQNKLSEHGGSIPGWLTEKGKLLLAALKQWEGAEDAANPS